ncbi:MAG: UrcA family protein [Caulobacterales bacterium]|nr:UrcA family protein [Caulobacterales bacterium]
MRLRHPALFAAAGLAGAAALAAAVPAAAQTVYDDDATTVGEVVVHGARLGPDGRPDRLSEPVSYADLDLSTWDGRNVLRHRIRDTARRLCDEVNGPGGGVGDGLTRSCEDDAVRSASAQMHIAVNDAYVDRYAADASAVVRDDYPR